MNLPTPDELTGGLLGYERLCAVEAVRADREAILKVVEEMQTEAERDPVRMIRAGKMVAYDAVLAILRVSKEDQSRV